jgi:hypothetical protein
VTIEDKVEEAARVIAHRDVAFREEGATESDLVDALVTHAMPVLPALCSRHKTPKIVFRGLEIAPRLYLDERGRFRIFIESAEFVCTPTELPARYGRGSARLVAFALHRALDALIAGGSEARANEAKRLAEKYHAVITLLRDRT